jgi:hypothetical protein
MPDEPTLTYSSSRLAARREAAAAMLEAGDIDADLHAGLTHLIEAEAQDQLVGKEPLFLDYGSRCSHDPTDSRWRRVKQRLGAKRKFRRRASMRAESIPGSR